MTRAVSQQELLGVTRSERSRIARDRVDDGLRPCVLECGSLATTVVIFPQHASSWRWDKAMGANYCLPCARRVVERASRPRHKGNSLAGAYIESSADERAGGVDLAPRAPTQARERAERLTEVLVRLIQRRGMDYLKEVLLAIELDGTITAYDRKPPHLKAPPMTAVHHRNRRKT